MDLLDHHRFHLSMNILGATNSHHLLLLYFILDQHSLFFQILCLDRNFEKVSYQAHPYHYESQRWSLAKEVSNGEGFFRCKHGSIPDPGKHGEDSIRYFGWHERFLVPFVNRTRVTRLQEAMMISNGTSLIKGEPSGSSSYSSPWAVWTFNATRRRCVHNALNVLLLTMPDSKKRTNLTQYFKDSCSVC